MAKFPYSSQIALQNLQQNGGAPLDIPSNEDPGVHFRVQVTNGILTVELRKSNAPAPRLTLPDLNTVGKKLTEKDTLGKRMNEKRPRTFKKNQVK
ncbi:hypothetical protein JYY74_004248 [Salmonella enterica subsp. enterica serovar Enteritidis]|nr:hypothetical protein [Salmonella enterica subsp. enterica serovar Enteritidis]